MTKSFLKNLGSESAISVKADKTSSPYLSVFLVIKSNELYKRLGIKFSKDLASLGSMRPTNVDKAEIVLSLTSLLGL